MIAPRYVLLRHQTDDFPGDMIQEGDEYLSARDGWKPCSTLVGQQLAMQCIPIRRILTAYVAASSAPNPYAKLSGIWSSSVNANHSSPDPDAYARGLRDAASIAEQSAQARWLEYQLTPKNSTQHEYLLHRMRAASTIADDILALIPKEMQQ